MSFPVAAPSLVSNDDEQLVREAARGGSAAFAELYSRYARVIHGILLARVPVSDAEDLVQEVFITAFRKLPGLREPGAFRGWLSAIARNLAMDHHRGARWFSPAPPRDSAAHAPGYDDAVMVLDAIRKLPEAYRETLILRFVEGMTGPEIAERTGLTPDSVRVNLFRGTKMLRDSLGREG